MKNKQYTVIGLALLFGGISGNVLAEGDITQRIRVNTRIGLSYDADIRYATDPAPPIVSTTVDGDAYNYDNGYVLPGPNGNVGGVTWYWGYDDPAQVVGNGIQMSRSSITAASEASGMHESTAFQGLEIFYSHEVQEKDGKFFGFDIGGSIQPINFEHRGTYNPEVTTTVEEYEFLGVGVPGAPYMGGFAGPGPRVSTTPTLISESTAAGAAVAASSELNAVLWGIHLGPYMDVPLSDRFFIHASGGLTLGLLDVNLDWENAGVAAGSGSAQDYQFVGGAFFGAELNWYANESWFFSTGLKFEYLNSYTEELDGNEVHLDLNHSLYWTLGLGRQF